MLNPYANRKNDVFDGDRLRAMPILCSYQSHIQWDNEIQSEDELNEYGYRSPEFDAGIENIAIGCSWTFGTALKYEDVWANIWGSYNLAAPGASNDYVSRTLLSAVEYLNPKRVVVVFPRSQRREHFDHLSHYFYNNYYRWRDHGPILKEVLAYHDGLNTEESNYINFYKNYMLVELLMKVKNIDWRFAIVPPEGAKNKLCKVRHRDDYDFIDPDLQIPFEVVDFAKDGKHPGPDSHRLFAEKVTDAL